MWTALAAIPLLAAVALVLGYYAFAKLTYGAYACGSFAKLDGELGWVLKPSASSCLGGHDAFSPGPPWFEVPVATDASGFRAFLPGGETPTGGIMAVGDSYTFGYGVPFEESYPGLLQAATGVSVVDVASPAYSSAQALLLAERSLAKLRPRAIVYLEMGQWSRDACRGASRPQAILKPCYWQPPGSAEAELVLPPAGLVQRWAAWGVLPGGMIGAGEISWDYFLVSRPVLQVVMALARFGMMPGFAHDFAAVGVDGAAMRGAAVRQLGVLAADAKVPVILLDPGDALPPEMLDKLPPAERGFIHRIGKALWDVAVALPAASLPPEQQHPPHDDHFGPGTNRLIAALLAKELRALGVVQ